MSSEELEQAARDRAQLREAELVIDDATEYPIRAAFERDSATGDRVILAQAEADDRGTALRSLSACSERVALAALPFDGWPAVARGHAVTPETKYAKSGDVHIAYQVIGARRLRIRGSAGTRCYGGSSTERVPGRQTPPIYRS